MKPNTHYILIEIAIDFTNTYMPIHIDKLLGFKICFDRNTFDSLCLI